MNRKQTEKFQEELLFAGAQLLGDVGVEHTKDITSILSRWARLQVDGMARRLRL